MTAAVLDMRPAWQQSRHNPLIAAYLDHTDGPCSTCAGVTDPAGSHRWRPPARYNGPAWPWLTGWSR